MQGQDFTPLIAGLKSSGRPQDARIHDALLQVKQRLDNYEQRLSSLELFKLNTERLLAGAGVYVKYFFLQADITIPMPSEPAGSLIFYLFLQDSTGGWVVTLPEAFVGFFPDSIGLDADRFSTLIAFKQRADLVVPAAFGISDVVTTP